MSYLLTYSIKDTFVSSKNRVNCLISALLGILLKLRDYEATSSNIGYNTTCARLGC